MVIVALLKIFTISNASYIFGFLVSLTVCRFFLYLIDLRNNAKEKKLRVLLGKLYYSQMHHSNSNTSVLTILTCSQLRPSLSREEDALRLLDQDPPLQQRHQQGASRTHQPSSTLPATRGWLFLLCLLCQGI